MDESKFAGWALVLSAPAPGKSRVHACATRTYTSSGESADSSTLGAAVGPEPPSRGTSLQGDSVILSPVKIRDVYSRGLRDELTLSMSLYKKR